MDAYDIAGLELTHLRYFVVLAEELHFGRAAERLHISQPPLTQQIQRLEMRIGHALLRRTSRRTELTEAGRVFYDVARGILQEAQRGLESTRRVARGELGMLTLATPPSLMLDALPRAILAFRNQMPAVDLRLREMATSRIFDAIESGAADVGLVRGPNVPDSLQTLASWKEPLVAILPQKHRLARTRRFALKLLAKEPFVFFPRDLGPGFYEELLNYCREAGFEPRITQEATQWSSVISLVSAGIGVSIGPASVVKSAQSQPSQGSIEAEPAELPSQAACR
jgi:DNA-binding transcriptional LysR family regulator